jgi:hypothetical protein
LVSADIIANFFIDHNRDLLGVVDLARQIRDKITRIDPFIQSHTARVCPECRHVCCINRHAYYECDDLIYIYALGLSPLVFEQGADEEPCQFLAPSGCRLDRTVRPSGCNWYFCDPLYVSMERSEGTAYTDFDNSLQELADLWIKLGGEFRIRFRTVKGHEIEWTRRR